MDWETSFDEYLEHLCETIGHSDRRAGLVGYCQGLMCRLRVKVLSRWRPISSRIA